MMFQPALSEASLQIYQVAKQSGPSPDNTLDRDHAATRRSQ